MAKNESSGFSKIIGVLFIASLILNVYLYMKDDSGTTDPEPCAGLIDPADCPDPWPTKSYDLLRESNIKAIKGNADSFKSKYPLPNYQGVINAQALERIFAVDGTNAIGYVLLVDPDYKDTTSIAIGGVSVTEISPGKFNCTNTSDIVYITDLWCPPGCLIAK